MEIKIKDNNYPIKYTIRSLFVFEQLTDKPFALKLQTDFYIYLYAMLIANHPDCVLTFDELIAACDEDASIMDHFLSFVSGVFEHQAQFRAQDSEDSKKKD